MKRYWPGLLIAGIAVAAWLAYGPVQPTGKLPDSVFENMEFGKDFDALTGDKNGVVCHEVRLITDDGEETVVWHKLWHHDFRKMTVAQKRVALRKDTQEDMREVGLACADPSGRVWLSQAYAQPHCDTCGGGCGTKSCPGTVAMGGGCLLGGTNCVITFICCSGPCPNC